MSYKLLESGERADFTTLALDVDKNELRVLANYPAPYNASWVEPCKPNGRIDRLIGLSEGDESGLLYTFEVDHEREACRITSQQPTLGAPGHCKFVKCYCYNGINVDYIVTTLRDGSALALATVSLYEALAISLTMPVSGRFNCTISHQNQRRKYALARRISANRNYTRIPLQISYTWPQRRPPAPMPPAPDPRRPARDAVCSRPRSRPRLDLES